MRGEANSGQFAGNWQSKIGLRIWKNDQEIGQNGRKGRKRLKQQLQDKLIEHKQYIDKYGEDLPEIRNWKWGATNAGKPA